MKRIFSKIAVLMILVITSTYFISGTAFAHNTTTGATPVTSSITKGIITSKHPLIPTSRPQSNGTPAVTIEHPNAVVPAINRSGQDTVVFVHGISPAAIPLGVAGNFQSIEDSTASDCSQYWGDAINYMNSNTHGAFNWGRKDFRTVKFYNGDTNCSNGWDTTHSPDLHNSEYASHCTNYPNSNRNSDGTFNEDLYHVSCLFAWYIYDNFGQHAGWNVELVAHSMGGLIIHNAIYQVQYRNQLGTGNTFPPTLGSISDVVTFNTPHQGHNLNWFVGTLCNLSLQCKQMDPQSSLTQEMNTARARNSQAGATDWTLIGSECDPYVSANSATITWDVGHKVVYGSGYSTCYNHGGAIHDTQDSWNAPQYWCDSSLYGTAACNTSYTNFYGYGNGPSGLFEMLNALWSDQY